MDELKERLKDRPVVWSGLRQCSDRRRIIIDRKGLLDSIPLPQALHRDIEWHTDGRRGAVDAAFNPSIFRLKNGETWMLYRCECIPWFKFSKIAIVQLDALLCPIKETNRLLDLPTDYDGYNAEDPRFIAESEYSVFISYNDGFRQAVAELSTVTWEVRRFGFIREVGGMRLSEKEKNWAFQLREGGKAAVFECVYSLHPYITLEVVLGDSGAVASARAEKQWGCTWPHGQIRGGTGWFPFQGKRGMVFHSSLKIADCKHGPVRQYFAGLLLADESGPVSISTQPLLVGEPGAPENRPSQHQVVFPAGAISHSGSVVVSYGLDDTDCALACWTPDELSASLQPIQ